MSDWFSYKSLDNNNVFILANAVQTITNKTLSGNIATNFIDGAGHTFSFPAVTDTAAGIAATQNLTNKTFLGGTITDDTIIKDRGTGTRQMVFTLSGMTANQTQTFLFSNTGNSQITFPNVTADTLTCLAATQSLTNKTISFPTSGGTPAALNYNETTTLSTAWTGPWAAGSNPTVVIKLARIGTWVQAYIPAIQATGNSTSAAVSNVTALPANYRPTGNNFNPLISVLDGSTSTNVVGAATVNTLGTITFGATANFANFIATTNNTGVNACSLTWQI